MKNVYIVTYTNTDDKDDIIGVYKSLKAANDAMDDCIRTEGSHTKWCYIARKCHVETKGGNKNG